VHNEHYNLKFSPYVIRVIKSMRMKGRNIQCTWRGEKSIQIFYLDNLKGTDNLGDFDIGCEGNTEVDFGQINFSSGPM
jgi:hypothetical protein